MGSEMCIRDSIGGGDSACEEAAYLTKYGSKVHLLVRSEKLRASAAMIDRVKANSKIEIHWNTKVEKANGTDWLENIETINSQKGTVEIKVKGLFYAIGHTPNTVSYTHLTLPTKRIV